MFCKRCGYSLRSITGAACPECGAPFDPSDPRTYGYTWTPLRRSVRARVQLGLAFYPLAGLVFPYAAALAARSKLGRWPIWPTDGDGWRFTNPSLFTLGKLSWVLLPLVLLVSLAVSGAMLPTAYRQRVLLWWCGRFGLACAVFAGWVVAARADPGGLLSWFQCVATD